jgi:hypothetical protein
MYGSDEFKIPQKRGEVNASGDNIISAPDKSHESAGTL